MWPEAKLHLQLAEQFLTEGWRSFEAGSWNPAATLAINSVIHAKDAICIFEFGISTTNASHISGANELARIKSIGQDLATGFRRIMEDKTVVEYGPISLTPAAARIKLERADRFLDKVRLHLSAS